MPRFFDVAPHSCKYYDPHPANSMPPPRLRLSGARGVSRSDEVAAPSRLRPPVTLPMTQRGQEGSRNNGGFISTLSTGPSQGTQVAMKSTPRVLDSADVATQAEL
ncbi:hypothetical protein PSHT_14481 [Puccinia striiformis]|uniref:Uncharacterized protein n=1 Tax=Puccinia striiformis TaxID=27350 RepID=A0A2S4UJZ9_9BASI|nr:hypothetical protein PSHT_14481 [Puccinia striiformis]